MNKDMTCKNCRLSELREFEEKRTMYCTYADLPVHHSQHCQAYDAKPNEPKLLPVAVLGVIQFSPDTVEQFIKSANAEILQHDDNYIVLNTPNRVYIFPSPKTLINIVSLLKMCNIKYTINEEALTRYMQENLK